MASKRNVWPPKFVKVPVEVLCDETIPPAAFRFYVRLRALAWGASSLQMALDDVLHHTGLSRTRLFEYARTLRLNGALHSAVRGDAFECSFPGDLDAPAADPPPESDQSRKPGSPIPESGKPGFTPSLSINTDSESDSDSSKTRGEGGGIPKSGIQSRKAGSRPGKRDSGKSPDPRLAHPALVAFRETVKRFPSADVFDVVISALGEQPDRQRLAQCFTAWRARGYRWDNLAWLTEWYMHGIPEKLNGIAQRRSQTQTAGAAQRGVSGLPARNRAERHVDTDLPDSAVPGVPGPAPRPPR